MKHLYALTKILLVAFLGEVLHVLLPLPIPSSIYGLLLLFLLLCFKVIEADDIEPVSTFLIQIMPILFVVPLLKITQFDVLFDASIWKILLVIILGNIIVLIVTSKLSDYLLALRKRRNHGNDI